MIIGLLTIPFNNNYGGYLQYAALKIVLEKMGHTVVLINRRQNGFFNTKLKQLKHFIHYHLLGHKHLPYNKSTYEKRFQNQGALMLKDVSKYLQPSTDKIYEGKEYQNLHGTFDVIIVGSDQVWRPLYVPDIYEFYLKFADTWHIKRISYAASFGTEEPEYSTELCKECGRLLDKFDAISVREQSSINLIPKLFGIEADRATPVLDPTMLLGARDYKSMFELSDVKAKRCFTYFLDPKPEKIETAERYAKDHGLTIVHFDGKTIPLISIKDWLDYIANSQIVFTDSFHGSVFSIIFHTPFYVFDNSKRGNMRMDDLLDPLGLTDRKISINHVPNLSGDSIDWQMVDSNLKARSKSSLSFLENALNDIDKKHI